MATILDNSFVENFHLHACMLSCSVQLSCPALCNPMDCSLPGSSRQEYGSGLPFPSSRDLPNPGIEPTSPALKRGTLWATVHGPQRLGDDWATNTFYWLGWLSRFSKALISKHQKIQKICIYKVLELDSKCFVLFQQSFYLVSTAH